MQNKLSHLFVFSLFYFVPIFETTAQNLSSSGKIKGRVTDLQQKPVFYATVSLLRAADSTLINRSLSTANGEFIFENLSSGIYLVAVDYIGYKKSRSKPITLERPNRIIDLDNINLIAEAKQLNTVSIVKKKPLIETKNGIVILNIAGSILATGNSAMEILSKAPGVTADKDGHLSLREKVA